MFGSRVFRWLALLAVAISYLPNVWAIERAVPGEILVRFAPSASAKERRGILATHGARVVRHFPTLELDHLALPAGADVASEIASMRARGEVILAQPNYIRRISAEAPPNDPFWLSGALWGLAKIQAQMAWTQFGGGDGSVVLAGVDTGVNYNHPDLAANIWTNPGEIPGNGIDDDGNGYIDDVHGIDAINHDGDPMDDNGHGTHTAGTMASVGNNGEGVTGVSWKAKMVICKCLDASGYGEDAQIIECLDYLVALKQRGVNIRASNNSFNGFIESGEPFPDALKAAYDAAGDAGILTVCSAGNFGTDNDSNPSYPAAFDSPSLVAVAASDSADNRAYFSCVGATSIDLAAPGVDILSTEGSAYGYLSGTSMSTPHVTGAVALLAQLDPGASVATIKSLLLNNVDVLPQWSGLTVTSGRLNLARAAQSASVAAQKFSVTNLSYRPGNALTLIWSCAPGLRYRVLRSDGLTSSYAPLSDALTAGNGQSSLSFTDTTATVPRNFYRVEIVP